MITKRNKLQWGRGGEAAEREPQHRHRIPHVAGLQWGRGGEAAERQSHYGHSARDPNPFNGAAAVRPRKGDGPGGCGVRRRPSMGPRR